MKGSGSEVPSGCDRSKNAFLSMSGQSGVVERASAELSKRINGLNLRVTGKHQHRNASKSTIMERMTNALCHDEGASCAPMNATSTTTLDKPLKHRSCKRLKQLNLHPKTVPELFMNDEFLHKFFAYFTPMERGNLARVCPKWRDLLYRNPRMWSGLMMMLNCKQLRTMTANEKMRLYSSFMRRGFRSMGLMFAGDDDINELIHQFPMSSKCVHSITLKWSGISDRGLENLAGHLKALFELEIIGCNDLTEAGLWACLTPNIISLKLADCINVADEAVGAVAQLLPSLCEFSLQAYHVTDAALGFFSTKQSISLSILKLQSCWEISNHGVVNIVHSLPNLTVLSLSGCTKITDDGVELITENLKKLRSLDLSWCPRISDIALEYIACDLPGIQQLSLDRCVSITDIGIGYLSTMPYLQALFLRWCSQITDCGIQHLSSMRCLRTLSIAGCPLPSSGGLCNFAQMKCVQELELTNCPAASTKLCQYLQEQLPQCNIVI